MMRIIRTLGSGMKIYNFDGKKNICGTRVKLARKKKKMTQEELAAKMQIEGVLIERNSICKMEIGERFVADYELVALSKILEVSIQWLLTIDQNI